MEGLFAFLSLPGTTEMVVLLLLAVLLFGQNLPEVARKAGKYYNDFRRAMQNIEGEFRSVASQVTSESTDREKIASPHKDDDEDSDEPTAPKFVPPT